jgi:thiamine-phosphate pyrophosphorylase
MPPAETLAKVRNARLYLLLTREICREPPLAVLRAAIAGGVDLVQVREPAAADGALVDWVLEVRAAAAPTGVPVIVNDRADVALVAGADGVHLGQKDLSPDHVRTLAGDRLVLGWSTHGAADLDRAAALPVDYCGLGPVFDTATKGLEGRGLELLREGLPRATRPTFAIGGITLENAAQVKAAGAARIAVSSAICGSRDPGAAARVLRSLVA